MAYNIIKSEGNKSFIINNMGALEAIEEAREHLAAMCGENADIQIISTEEIGDGAIMAVFTFDGEEQTAIYYPADDTLFTPRDWQSGRPTEVSDIENYEWINSAGDTAVVLAGLPRTFTAIRDEARKNFGKTLKAKREAKGLTLADLAKRTGLQRQNINRIETGRYNVTLDTITRLSAALGEDLI